KACVFAAVTATTLPTSSPADQGGKFFLDRLRRISRAATIVYPASKLVRMNQLLAILLLALCIPVMGQTAPSATATAPTPMPPASSSPVAQENALKARTLLNEAIAALGGQAYLNIQDISQQGRTYSFHMGQPNSAGLEFWRFYKYPDKDRYELTKQRDVVELYNGDKAIEITYKGAQNQDAKDAASYRKRRPYAL